MNSYLSSQARPFAPPEPRARTVAEIGVNESRSTTREVTYLWRVTLRTQRSTLSLFVAPCIGGIAHSKYKLLLLTTTHMILSLSNTSKLELSRMAPHPSATR